MNPKERPRIKQTFVLPPTQEQLDLEEKMTLEELEARLNDVDLEIVKLDEKEEMELNKLVEEKTRLLARIKSFQNN